MSVYIYFQNKDVINTVIIAPNNVTVVGAVDSHPSNLEPTLHTPELTFIVVGVPEQSFEESYLSIWTCPLTQVTFSDVVAVLPTQNPGK